MAKVYIGVNRTDKGLPIARRADDVETLCTTLATQVANNRSGYTSAALDRQTGNRHRVFSVDKWTAGHEFERDIRDFVTRGQIEPSRPSANPAALAEFVSMVDETFPLGAKLPQE